MRHRRPSQSHDEARKILRKEDEIIDLDKQILRELRHDNRTVTHFRITQEPHMPITGILPGATGVFVAVPLNAAGAPVALPLSTVPVWTSSDPLAVVTANPDGLGASVAVDPSAPQGGSFVLTVAQADGSASTPTTVPYDNIPVDNTVASFGVSQTI